MQLLWPTYRRAWLSPLVFAALIKAASASTLCTFLAEEHVVRLAPNSGMHLQSIGEAGSCRFSNEDQQTVLIVERVRQSSREEAEAKYTVSHKAYKRYFGTPENILGIGQRAFFGSTGPPFGYLLNVQMDDQLLSMTWATAIDPTSAKEVMIEWVQLAIAQSTVTKYTFGTCALLSEADGKNLLTNRVFKEEGPSMCFIWDEPKTGDLAINASPVRSADYRHQRKEDFRAFKDCQFVDLADLEPQAYALMNCIWRAVQPIQLNRVSINFNVRDSEYLLIYNRIDRAVTMQDLELVKAVALRLKNQ